jgi:tellurite resistance protein TehA-like permease
MDSRFQPEGLSFDNGKDTFNPNFDNNEQTQYTRPQSDPRPGLYSVKQGLPTTVRPQGPQGPQGPQDPQGPPYSQGSMYARESRFVPQPEPQYMRQSTPENQYPQRMQQNNQYPTQSNETTRSNTWVHTPPEPYHPAGDVYYTGPVDVNGYPIDAKTPNRMGENPFNDPPRSSPTTAVNSTVDLEKQKHDDGHGHGHSGWDHNTKLPHKKDPNQPYLPYSERLRHFTWAWYTLTMATGGLSTLIAIQPHAFPGLITIGAVFYILNLIFFTVITGTMVLRFTKFPGSFKASISHEREALFLGPFFLSVATIITGTQKYVIQAYEADHPNRAWAVTSMSIAFWLYTFFAFCLASFQYSFLFCSHTYKLTSFMPSWLLPIFPVMLSGTIASVIAADQPLTARFPIIVAGLGCQGLGFTVAILMYAHYIGRLMQVGYPDREHRGAMFIGVGPPSFTCLALIGMANALPDNFDLQGDGLIDSHMLRTLALVVALFLWVLAMWFFMIALVAVSLASQDPNLNHSLIESRLSTPGLFTSIWVGGLWFSPTVVSPLLPSPSATHSRTRPFSTLEMDFPLPS